jgi:PAS domain S-box-containing protein
VPSPIAADRVSSAASVHPVNPKVGFAFSITLLTVLLVSVAMYRNIVLFEAATARRQHSLAVIAAVRTAVKLTLDAETAARGYALTGSEPFLEPYHTATLGLSEEVRRFRALVRGTRSEIISNGLESLVAERLERSRELIELRRERGLEAAAEAVGAGKGKVITDEIRTIAGAVEAEEATQLRAEGQAIRDRSAMVKRVAVLASILTFLIVTLAAFLIGREDRARRAADKALRQAHATLEEQVENRTAELRQSNESLRESEQQLRAAQQMSKIGSWTWDATNDIAIWSDQMYELFERPPEEGPTKYQDLSTIFPPDSLERLEEAIQFASSSGQAYEIQVETVRKDGSRCHLISRGNVLRDSGGAVVGLQGTVQDVTERVRLEARVQQSQKMEAIGRLAGGIAHDFNNLLMVINGLSAMQLESMDPADPNREALAAINAAGERAAALTQQILAFSRKQVIQPRILNLNRVVQEIETLLRRAIGEDVDLAIVLDSALQATTADPAQISQVLMNLVVNARDAMPEGGHITIETHNVELDETYARTHPEVSPGRYVQLTVSDSGSGIDPKTLTHIFEPFFTTKATGTGLGLATAHSIVAASMGSIEVYSEVGTGTAVKIYLPAAENGEVHACGGLETPAKGGSETILLVEDQDEVRKLVLSALQSCGYNVVAEASGPEAMAASHAFAGPIHLLLTDVVMRGMSGIELAERVARQRAGMKVLFMSGYTENAVEHRGMLQQGAAFLQKPVSPDALARKVRELLGSRSDSGAILIADDEEGVRRLLEKLLKDAGYNVVTAGDGNAAIRNVASQDFDVAIVDMVMPGKEGIETIQALRRHRPWLKVVAMSGSARAHPYLEAAQRLGASAVLQKPVLPDDLLQIVRRLSPVKEQ